MRDSDKVMEDLTMLELETRVAVCLEVGAVSVR